MTIIAPSILSADFAKLGAEVRAVEQAGADWIHLDVMDGHFVPNLTFGPGVVSALRASTDKPFDVHLMIAPVEPYIGAFADAGADTIIVHVEAGPHVHRAVQMIRARGKRAGIALNPGTPAALAEPLIDTVDLVLCMTVNPGFGGQSFIPSALETVSRVRDMAAARGRSIDIEVDGGVTPETIGAAARAGATAFVAGSSVFGDGPDGYARNIAALRARAEDAVGRGTLRC